MSLRQKTQVIRTEYKIFFLMKNIFILEKINSEPLHDSLLCNISLQKIRLIDCTLSADSELQLPCISFVDFQSWLQDTAWNGRGR